MRLQQGAPFCWQLGARAMPPAAHGLLAARQPVRAARCCCTGCELESSVAPRISSSCGWASAASTCAAVSQAPHASICTATLHDWPYPCPLFLGRAGIRQSGGSAACACCLALPHTATAQHGYRACHAPRAIGNSAQHFLRQPCVGASRPLGRKAAAAAHLWQAYWLVPIDHITSAATPSRVWQPNAPCSKQASCPACATQSHASITIGLAYLSRQLTGGKSTVKYCSNEQYVDLASFFLFFIH